jgi:hypothetical protein
MYNRKLEHSSYYKQQDLPLQHKQQDKQTTRLTSTTQTTRQTNNKTYLYNTNNKRNKQQDLPLQHKQQDKQTTRLTFTTQTTRNTNNKTHEHQDKEIDTKTSTHKTNKLGTTIRLMNIKTKSTIPRQTHTKQKNSHLVSQDFTHRMISKSQQKLRLTSKLNSNTFI